MKDKMKMIVILEDLTDLCTSESGVIHRRAHNNLPLQGQEAY
jgi:hypothetical protein